MTTDQTDELAYSLSNGYKKDVLNEGLRAEKNLEKQKKYLDLIDFNQMFIILGGKSVISDKISEDDIKIEQMFILVKTKTK